MEWQGSEGTKQEKWLLETSPPPECLNLKILRMELSCREIKKRKKGGRRVKREIENEKKEDGRAEIIKV